MWPGKNRWENSVCSNFCKDHSVFRISNFESGIVACPRVLASISHLSHFIYRDVFRAVFQAWTYTKWRQSLHPRRVAMAAPDCLALQEVIHEVDVWMCWLLFKDLWKEKCAVLLKCIVMYCHVVILSCFKSFWKYCNWAGLPKTMTHWKTTISSPTFCQRDSVCR